MTISRVQQWPFVGRDCELGTFSGILADPRRHGFVIYGPAGVGKSRLAEACLKQAVDAGYKEAYVKASAAASTVPLGAVAHLIPDGVDLSNPVRGFADVAAALTGARRERRWALWVDDLHLLDAASAVLMRQLMDTGAIRLVATVRSGEPASEAVNALCHGDAVHRVDLKALSPEECERLLQEVLGAPVGRRTLLHLHDTSRGNVLYLHELVLGAVASGGLVFDGEVWALSGDSLAGTTTPRLTELVGARLAAAGQECHAVLELLALCEPVPLADAEAMAALDVLVELEQASLIRITAERRRTTVSLAHPLYGENLREQIPLSRRRELLVQQAERTEARGAKRREDPLHIATWRLAALGTADPDLLVRAASLSFHAHDYAQAIALLKPLPSQLHTTATRLMLGYSMIELGQWESAELVLADADKEASGEKDRLEVALARIISLFWLGSRTQESLAVTQNALQQVSSPEGRRTLHTIEGYVRVISGAPNRGLALLEEHLEADPSTSYDLNTWLRGALTKTLALAATGRTAEATAWASRAYTAHMRAEEEQQLVPHPATQLSTPALAEAGRITEALAEGERAFNDLLTSADTIVPRLWVAFCLGRTEWLAGHPGTARAWLTEALTPAREINHVNALRLVLSYSAAAAAQLGDLDAAKAAIAESERYPVAGYLRGEERLGEAWMLAAQGRQADACNVLREAAQEARAANYLTSEALLLTEAARLGSSEAVAERLFELTRICDGLLTPLRARFAQALAADVPGELLAVSDELKGVGVELLAAEAAAAAASALRRAGDGRRATAASNLAAAARVEGAWTPLLTSAEAAAELTSREREIALLAAANTTSKDIAQRLSLSVRTVDNHLHHAYAKLGVTTRRELLSALQRTQ
ncbi:LuxR C-terminal-related transcriptional regulator [Streptomyces sp. NPDC056534]|uniref:LuxR C-terminal-related transcriptional regulator n=1 Tax=Streptomyces sp. NPDC056534 TaxID=3345857 RepID=UPI0036D0E0E2